MYTDSVFFSATPLMDNRLPNWKNETQEIITGYVNDIATEVQDYLNNFYDVLAPKIFNIDKDKHRFEIKKEYVAKSGIWIAKKRYAQWIISDNGLPVDRLDVKGLDVKRSSFPTAFKGIMSEVLISILKGETEQDLSDKVLKFKKSLPSIKVKSISKNSAVKELSKYVSSGDRHLFQFKKGTPAHVKAGIAYNDLLIHYKCDFKYAPLSNGSKIKWIYLRNNPLGLDALGFTGYQDPPEILELLETYAHHDKMFERDLEGKLQDFWDSLGWGKVIDQKKSAEKFFSF